MRKPRLLVIDDDPAVRALLRRVGERLGYRVAVLAEGYLACDAWEILRPDVILLDIVMPDRDGIELLQAFAARGCRSRLILMSGAHPQYLKSATLLGDAYGLRPAATLLKPFDLEALRDVLREPSAASNAASP